MVFIVLKNYFICVILDDFAANKFLLESRWIKYKNFQKHANSIFGFVLHVKF